MTHTQWEKAFSYLRCILHTGGKHPRGRQTQRKLPLSPYCGIPQRSRGSRCLGNTVSSMLLVIPWQGLCCTVARVFNPCLRCGSQREGIRRIFDTPSTSSSPWRGAGALYRYILPYNIIKGKSALDPSRKNYFIVMRRYAAEYLRLPLPAAPDESDTGQGWHPPACVVPPA